MSASIGAPEGKTLRRWILTSLIIAYGLAGVGLILTASIVVPWYLGDGYKAAIPVAELLGVALCVTGVSTALTLALIAHGQARISSRVLIAAALFHVILLPIACANFGALGAAGAVCATEVLIACLLGWSYRQFLERNSLARTQLPSRSTQGGLVNPTVTIVMPVYNTEDLVERAIHSVLRQSYRNFELIIIDDASTDNSLSAVHSALQDAAPETRSKVRVIARDKNEGYASATNTGVSMSRGEWVWFVDGDDWAEPEMLQRILDAALEHSAEIVVTRMRRVRLATGSGKVLSEWAPRNSVSTGREALKRLARGELLAFQTNKLIARGLWEGIVSPCNTYSDAAIMPELLRRARRVAFVKEPLYNYCRRAESVTGSLRPSAWDLTALPDFISPVLNEVFASRTAQALQKHFIYSVVYWSLINGSASDDSQGGLAKEVHSWARDRIRWNDLLWFATRGRFTLAASLGLAKAAPQLHRQVLGYYKRVSS
jgi:glycosyltransferase involved in cell wall biosynthesis